MKEYAKNFYKSDAWKRARKIVIARSNGLCERCLAAGLHKPGYIVHHKEYITPGNINDPNVTLNTDNLEYVCDDCHNKEHKSKRPGRYRFDSNGNLLPPIDTALPPVGCKDPTAKEPRELPTKNAERSCAYEGG